MVTDLIDDTNQTLDAVNDARGSIQDLQATDARIEQQQQDRNAAGNAFESGLFEGFGDAPAPAPVAAEPEAPVAAPVAAEPAPVPVPVEQHAAPDYMRTSAPEYGGVMGGAASAVAYEQPAMAPMGGTSMTSAPSALNPDSFGHNSSMGGISQSLSTEEIDAIKQQVTELDRKAVAAEDSQRQLMAQAEALRQDAEQAELAAAEKASAAEGKKKKKFGGGKKGAMVRFSIYFYSVACIHDPSSPHVCLTCLPLILTWYHRRMPMPHVQRPCKRSRPHKLLRPLSAMHKPKRFRRNVRRMSFA